MYHIYLISNDVNSKIYVGKTKKTPEIRLRDHFHCAKSRDVKSHLYAAIRKYGPDKFHVRSLATAETDDQLDSLEKFFILFLGSNVSEFGYNCTKGGDGSSGRKMSEETKAKISVANTGRKFSEEAIARRSKSNSGPRHHSFGKPFPEWVKQRRKEVCFRKLPLEEVKELYLGGLSCDKIASKFGVSGATINNRLHDLGVPLREPVCPRPIS